MKKFFIFLVFIIITFMVETIGSFFVRMSLNYWYQTLFLPPDLPPNHLFTIIWIILYLFIAFSGAILWIHRRARIAKKALIFWCVGLVLNLIWPMLFFGLENPLLGAIDISFLIVVAFITMVTSFMSPQARLSGWFFIPYVLWLIYAGYLNWMIFYLN
jgi:benzodiazapine receptor